MKRLNLGKERPRKSYIWLSVCASVLGVCCSRAPEPKNLRSQPSRTASSPQTLSGRVVRVADGDTITVLDATNTQYRVRLEGIDAPESHQAFGTQSKKNLSDIVFGREVTVVYRKT